MIKKPDEFSCFYRLKFLAFISLLMLVFKFTIIQAEPNSENSASPQSSTQTLPSPFDSVFPSTEYIGPIIGVSSSGTLICQH